MKKYLLTLIILVIPYLVNAQSSKTDLRGKIGISLYGGVNIPVNGEYSSSVKMTEFLKVGSQFGVGVSYYITKGFGVEGTLNAGYNHHREKYEPAGKEPLWVNLSSTLNVIYNFGHMFRNPVVSPFVRVGAGSYQWEHFEDGLIGGVITKQNNNHDVGSFGFTIGAGAEYFVHKKFSVGLLLDYNMHFPRQENLETHTNERTVHGFFAPQIKLSYYIPTR